MKRSPKSRKGSLKKQSNTRVFTTVDEFSTYFFPKGRPDKEVTRGKERGAKEAKNAFTEIGGAL
jgi:hypothetical protein